MLLNSMEIKNERNRSLEHSKRRVQEKENEEKEEMTILERIESWLCRNFGNLICEKENK